MKEARLFIILLKYTAPLDKIDLFREGHLKFLDKFYAHNIFIASGPQSQSGGGVIIAKVQSKTGLEKIMLQDPFIVNNLATLDIVEFTATKCSDLFRKIL